MDFMINIPVTSAQASEINILPDSQLPESGAFKSILSKTQSVSPENSADGSVDVPQLTYPEEVRDTGEWVMTCLSRRQSGNMGKAGVPLIESKEKYILEHLAAHDRAQTEGETTLRENFLRNAQEPVLNPEGSVSDGTLEDVNPMNNQTVDREENGMSSLALPIEGNNGKAGTALTPTAFQAVEPGDSDKASQGGNIPDEPAALSGDLETGESTGLSHENNQSHASDKKIAGEIYTVAAAELKRVSSDDLQQSEGSEKAQRITVPLHDVKTHGLQSSGIEGKDAAEDDGESEKSYSLRQKTEHSNTVEEMTADEPAEGGDRDYDWRKSSTIADRETDTRPDTGRHGADHGDRKRPVEMTIPEDRLHKTENTDSLHKYLTPSLAGKVDQERGMSERTSNTSEMQYHSSNDTDSPAVHHLERGHSALEGGKTLTNIHGMHASKADAFRELLNSIVYVAKGNARLGVTLEHDTLGRLNISVSMEKGLLNVHIDTADRGVRALIENNALTLVDVLNEEGLSVGEFSIALKGRHDGREEPVLLTGKEGEEAANEEVREYSGSGRVNIFA